MKKLVVLFLAALLCLALAACGAKEEKLSDEEVVNTFLQAYQQGDYEAMKPYIDDANPLHEFFANMDDETGGEMAPVCRAFHEKAKAVTWTAKAVEGQEAWGTVSLELTIPNYYEAVKTSMAAAIQADVSGGGQAAFRDVPGWLLAALDGQAETVQETYELHVGNRDGEMVMDTNTNRQFFTYLCGGLKEYLNASMTTCTFTDGTVWELAAKGDEIVGIIRSENIPGASMYAQEDLELVIQAFVAPYETMDGICAGGEVKDDLLISYLGIDMWTASSFDLVQMGLLDSMISSSSWLSLESTVSGFTRDGAECVTETFKPEQPAE